MRALLNQPQFGNGATRLQRLALAGPVVARPFLRPRPALGVGVSSYFASSPVSHTWQGLWPVSRVVGVYFKGRRPLGGAAPGTFPRRLRLKGSETFPYVRHGKQKKFA